MLFTEEKLSVAVKMLVSFQTTTATAKFPSNSLPVFYRHVLPGPSRTTSNSHLLSASDLEILLYVGPFEPSIL